MTIQNISRLSVFAALAICLSAATSGAAEWGTIKGKFVYKGEAKNSPIQITKDVEFCGPKMPVDESVSLGEGGALQNVFIYLYVARGKTVEIHPDYKPGEPKKLVNEGCRFAPHAMTVWTAEEFEVHNDDTIGHNTNFSLAVNPDFNLTVPNDAPIKKKFDKSEPMPSKVLCNIHPWMSASVLVRDNPYMAVTGADGSFEIKNVPVGEQEFVLWHEAKGYLRDLQVGEEKADRRGQFEVAIKAGETIDLGTIEVTPDILGK